MSRNPIMLYHHQYDKALGQFTEAKVDQKGLWVKGRVDKPAPGSWAEDVFNKIKKKTIRSFSVGGIFERHMTKDGPKIHKADLGEISVTPFPVNPRTTFAVVAQKAFENKAVEELTGEEQETDTEIIETPEAENPETTETENIEVPEVEDTELVTGDHIAPHSIGVEHLTPELRSAFSELAPEMPTIQEVLQKLDEVYARLEANESDSKPGPVE